MRRALVFLLLLGCTPTAEPSRPDAPRLSVMTFNVENLFDTRDDPGKDDETYLPMASKATAQHKAACGRIEPDFRRRECLELDWSEKVLAQKMRRLADVILSVGGGKGPDILILQEVENLAVLERLRKEYLPAAGYLPGILIEGGDRRGIDQAVLTRLEVEGRGRLHYPPGDGAIKYRGILRVTLRLPEGELLTVFAVHLPAAYSPRKFRVAALGQLNGLRARLPAGQLALAAGDFNITAGEDAVYGDLDRRMKDAWWISHRIGCANCLGTHYYAPKDEWSFLDMILFSKGDTSWKVLPESVRVVNDAPQQKGRGGFPARFDPLFGTGVSDHWPIVVELAKRRM